MGVFWLALKDLVANGLLKESVREAKNLAREKGWFWVAQDIAGAFGRDRDLFARFASLPRETQETLFKKMWPYALQASLKAKDADLGASWMIGAMLSLDFPELALGAVSELEKRNKWDAISDGIAYAFGGSAILSERFSALPRGRQEEMIRTMFPCALRASEYRANAGVAHLIGASLVLDFYDFALEALERLATQERWEPVSASIFHLLYGASPLSQMLISCPRAKQERMIRDLMPYAYRAAEREAIAGLAFLLSATVVLDFYDLAMEIANVSVQRNRWRILSFGIAGAFGLIPFLFGYFASLPQERQETWIACMMPYALEALEHREGEGIAYSLASAISLDHPELAVEIAERLEARNGWKPISEGIAHVFTHNDLSEHFRGLPHNRQLALWRLALPYAMQAAREGKPRGLMGLLKFHNPAETSWETWVNDYGEFIAISVRGEFLKTLSNLSIERLREAWRLVPEEYAGVLVKYIRTQGISGGLLEAVRESVAQRPELMGGITKLANEYPVELLPLIQEITSPQTDWGL